MTTLAEIREYNAFHLAASDRADCMSPDSSDSPGAVLLLRVRDAFVEAYEAGRFDTEDTNDVATEIANDLPSVYTYEKWKQFVDLGAWQEEAESGEWPTVLDDAASVALYQICERLFLALFNELETTDEDEDGEED
jgi:hypothetical protein